jgi:hypothetical protein
VCEAVCVQSASVREDEFDATRRLTGLVSDDVSGQDVGASQSRHRAVPPLELRCAAVWIDGAPDPHRAGIGEVDLELPDGAGAGINTEARATTDAVTTPAGSPGSRAPTVAAEAPPKGRSSIRA